MSKESRFKTYDKAFKHLKRTDDMESKETRERALSMNKWPYEVIQWSQDKVQEAVYFVNDAEEWQKFRVSLKGQSTRMKLLRLQDYYRDHQHLSGKSWEIEKCRIDNYIGALVRGGQLDEKHRVIK